MELLKKYLTNAYILYGIIALLLIGNVLTCVYFLKSRSKQILEEDSAITMATDEEISPTDSIDELTEEEKKKLHVDIKGYVKKPGVYEVEEGAIVNDIINLAGGVKSGGSTENINLSKKIVDESMIIISSKAELKKVTTCINTDSSSTETKTETSESTVNNNAVSTGFANQTESDYLIDNNSSSSSSNNSQDSSNTKISINTASKEELMTLSGIGEKTAEKIIAYRATQKFNVIEDLKNVSGIGDSLFEKIKDFITV